MAEPNNPFEDAAFALRQSWEDHRQAFGPILEPAFRENPQVRLLVIQALNYISRREIQKGMEELKQINPHCVYDEDKAAWTYFVGLCFEMAGAKKQMLQWYADAGKFGHRFYLPYLKLAKATHAEGELETALGYYDTAIGCLLEMEDPDEIVLGSAYANLTSCLTMLHRYSQAEKAWLAAQNYPQQPASAATAAILYAAMGNREQAAHWLARLEKENPAPVPQIRAITEQILSGTHPDFPPENPVG